MKRGQRGGNGDEATLHNAKGTKRTDERKEMRKSEMENLKVERDAH